jgi:2-keto-4-pentenoate hydratase/2-oxohepta-3-ene-1,7-dioic acid hydratase in catechol pathway
VTRPGKIVCVGRNYLAHARELGNELPAEPLIFLKPPSSVIADGEPIVLPPFSEQVEHEGEIGIVLGTRLKDADETLARAAVAAVVAANDVTARDLQRQDAQWTRAKGCDTFCPLGSASPLGPEFPLEELEVVCRVNGRVRQHGRAAEMHFSIPCLLAWISRVMTLEPGDVLLTGSPEGVGPLVRGDVVEVEIPGRGKVSNPVV